MRSARARVYGERQGNLHRLQRQERGVRLPLIGDKSMLTVAKVTHSPEIRCDTDSGASACPETWELRHTYVIGPRRRLTSRRVRDSKTVVYVDTELWFPLDANALTTGAASALHRVELRVCKTLALVGAFGFRE